MVLRTRPPFQVSTPDLRDVWIKTICNDFKVLENPAWITGNQAGFSRRHKNRVDGLTCTIYSVHSERFTCRR